MESEQNRPRERLCDPDPEVRYRAVMELDRADIGSLLSRLSDENWRVRKAAVERLAGLPDPSEVIGALIERLWDADDAGARNSAAEALARIGAPAIPPVAACLRVEDCDVRKLAADVLGDIRDPAASPALVAALGDADLNVRVAAAEALGRVGGAEAAGALEAILGSADGLLQLAALDALARIGRAPPIGVLAPLAGERFLKRSVLRLLGATPGRASLEIIAESLKDAARGTREEAFGALASQLELGHEKPQTIVQTLLAALKHPARLAQLAREALDASGPRAVAGAMRLLGMVGEPSDAPAIAAAARGEVLRDAAVTALQAMGVGAGPALVKALPDLQPEARLVAIEALARLRERSALSALVGVAEEGTEPERLLAIEALGALGDSGAIEALFALVEEGELAAPAAEALAALGKAERRAVLEAARARVSGPAAAWAIRVLGAVGGKDDLPMLKAALRSERTEVRLAATEAALSLGEPGAEEMLRIALADEAPEVRAGAARGLAGFPSEDGFNALVAALRDREPIVAAAAAEALGTLGDRRAAGPLFAQISRGERNPGTPEVLPAIAAVRGLARLGAATPERLKAAAGHPDPEVVKEAVEAAAALPGAEEVLMLAARSARWDVRRAAARAIGMRGDRAMLERLRELAAAETDELVAQAFAEALRALEARPLPPEQT